MATPKWRKKLTRAQQKHVDETTASGFLWQLRNNFKHQQTMGQFCFTCEDIYRRLGWK